eukprot:3905741-Rhodomonas_salina.2
MKELRALRDNGDVSESEYRQRKEKLRELGKSGGGSGVETPPLRNRKDGKTKKEKSVPIPHNFQKVTWDMVKNSFEIDSIEDPVRRALMSAISTALFVTVYGRTQVTSCHMDKLKFGSIFGEMLKDLNGEGGYEDSYMDFYFERDVITSTLLKFINEERKSDWVEWAEETGVQPTMEVVPSFSSLMWEEGRVHRTRRGGGLCGNVVGFWLR